MSRRVAVQVTAGIVLVALVAIGAWLPMPYVSLSPGPVFDTLGEQNGEPLILIEGTTTYPTDGRLDLTTVSERGGPRSRLGLLEAVKDWVDPNSVVVPERTLYTGQETAEEVEQRNAEDMELSQENAVTAAMNQLGIATTTEVVVRSIAQDAPALGTLQAGDVILAIDGRAPATVGQARRILGSYDSGDVAKFEIMRMKKKSTVSWTVPAQTHMKMPGGMRWRTPAPPGASATPGSAPRMKVVPGYPIAPASPPPAAPMPRVPAPAEPPVPT